MIQPGQGLLLKINFADGGICKIKRTFLVIDNKEQQICLLNVSSLKGKEWKLGLESNIEISKYKPPFDRHSFVKLDALYIIPKEKKLESKILCKGRKINPKQLMFIQKEFENFKNTHKILSKVCTKAELMENNINNYEDITKEEIAAESGKI